MENLAHLTVQGFSELLASNAPAPGGGSTAALMGSHGAALVRMVAALTAGREKYREHEALAQELLQQAEELRAAFLDVMNRDTQAFNTVTAALALPKATPEEKAARQAAMQNALKACTQTPYEMMQLALRTLELAAQAPGKLNASAASDLGVAALSLRAAVQGAWLNILINIGGVKDEAFAAQYRQNGEEILAKALPLADSVYQAVLATM